MILKLKKNNSDINYATEQGKKAGIEEGEKNKQKEIAKKLLEEKIDIEIIVKATGLTKEEIEIIK